MENYRIYIDFPDGKILFSLIDIICNLPGDNERYLELYKDGIFFSDNDPETYLKVLFKIDNFSMAKYKINTKKDAILLGLNICNLRDALRGSVGKVIISQLVNSNELEVKTLNKKGDCSKNYLDIIKMKQKPHCNFDVKRSDDSPNCSVYGSNLDTMFKKIKAEKTPKTSLNVINFNDNIILCYSCPGKDKYINLEGDKCIETNFKGCNKVESDADLFIKYIVKFSTLTPNHTFRFYMDNINNYFRINSRILGYGELEIIVKSITDDD